MSYQIFTDVTSDLDAEILARFPELHMIPMNVNLGGQDYLYGPGGNLNIKDFYAEQRNGKYASTSQITPFAFHEQFEPVLDGGEDVLYLCFSSGLSNTYSTAKLTAEELSEAYPDRKIIVVDTLCAAVGEGFIVLEAMKRYREGAGIEELAAWVLERQQKVCHWFTVDTLDHLYHGGRVSKASATVGTLLNIKPLLHVDPEGKLEVTAKPRGRKQAMKLQLDKMKQGLRRDLGNLVVIGHGDCPDVAQNMKASVLEIFPEADVEIAYIGPVIGAHTGPGMLALIFWGDVR